jgi:hypothetical protein
MIECNRSEKPRPTQHSNLPTHNKIMKKISSLITILCVMTLTLWSGAAWGQVPPPTPFYSVTGTNGTGGGTASINIPPVNAPAGSTALVNLRGTTNFSFGLGSDGVAGGAISNTWAAQGDLQVLAGTLGAAGIGMVSNFTMTVWFIQPPATINNYRLGLISTGSPATTGSADGGATGNEMFWGENSGGGFQFYVNNKNGNSVGTSIANGANTWNNDGTLGAFQAGRWYFVAITYSVSPSNHCVLYSGSQSNTCVQVATFTGNGGTDLGGPLNLSAATSICLMNRFSGGRAFPGQMDYFNLYTNVLTLDQITAVQASEQPPLTIPRPSLSISPTNTFFALSPPVGVLTVAGNGGPPMYYQWKTDGGGGGALTNIPNATNTTLNFIYTNAGTYNYNCVVSNSYTVSGGVGAQAPLPVYVLPASVPQLTSDMNQSGTLYITNVYSFIGGSASFNAVFGLGTLPITNQWIANTGSGYASIVGATNNALSVTNIQTTAAGNYDLAATNLIGGSNSTPGHLTVLANPPAPSGNGVTNMYSYCVYTNNPWAYWKFEETNNTLTSSMQAYDYSGHYFHATYGHSDGTSGSGCLDGGESIHQNSQYGPGHGDYLSGFTTTNGCATMSVGANNGFLTVPPLNLNTNNNVTFTMWIYINPVNNLIAASTGLLMNRNGSDAAGLCFGSNVTTNDYGTAGVSIAELGYTWNTNNPATYGWHSGLYPALSTWNFVACTITPSNTTIYLDFIGQDAFFNPQTNLFKSVLVITNSPEAFSGGTTWIGSDNFSNARTFDGCIDEVAVFTNALSEAQIQALFFKSLGGVNTGAPPAIGNNPTPVSQNVLGNQIIQLSASGGGYPDPVYIWQSSPNGSTWTSLADGTGITGSHSNILTYTMNNTSLSFRLVLSNALGLATSSSATVTVTRPIPAGLWTANFQYTNNYSGNGYVGLGQFTGFGIIGNGGTYWNPIPNPAAGAGTYTSTTDLLDDGATHSGIVAALVSGGSFSSEASIAAATNVLLDAYSQILTTNATGSLLFTHVPPGRYNLALYGIDGTFADRGTVFTVNGVSQVTSNVQAAVYALGDNVVLYTNVLVTNGTLSVDINVNTNIARWAGTNWEAGFNGAQLQATTAGPFIWGLTKSGGNLVLNYQGGFVLQSTNITGPWTTNTTVGSGSITINPTGTMKFYRIWTNNAF